MFCFDRGLILNQGRLAVDASTRRPAAFVSHAHHDHMARHDLALCTPATAALYQLRLGKRRVVELPFHRPKSWGGLQLTTYPAGHCLGSAMLMAQDGERSLLYTGDFKLDHSETSEPAVLPQADILVMESTFGRPNYRFPSRERVVEELVAVVKNSLARGRVPVIQAYAVGKAQEVTRILTRHGIPVRHHPEVHEASLVYERCGMPLGDFKLYRSTDAGAAVIVPPRSKRSMPRIKGDVTTIVVSGWAVDRSARRWLGIDHAIPLSDHADFDGLLEAVRRVQPREVYCLHGPIEFVETLRSHGWNARSLDRAVGRVAS